MGEILFCAPLVTKFSHLSYILVRVLYHKLLCAFSVAPSPFSQQGNIFFFWKIFNPPYDLSTHIFPRRCIMSTSFARPSQIKSRLILSIVLIVPAGILYRLNQQIGTLFNTALSNTTLPAIMVEIFFHLFNFF